MRFAGISDVLWGKRAKLSYLMLAALIVLFTCLGAREIWTQEHRWSDIVTGMFYRHDFFHPYLGQNDYYDKPLLSYWLIALIAKITGQLTTFALRLPSACAGLLTIWSTYRLGTLLKNKQMGLLAGWLLLTTFYFVFWARTSSADMLNLAGSIFAVTWYFERRDRAGFFDYSVFFLIVALTSLCKGLVGAIVPIIAVFIDMLIQRSWRRHLSWALVLGMIPGLIVYLLPFVLSDIFSAGSSYGQNGLYLVYKENILRYFQPFDHKGPLYTYFIFLPVYLLPWAFFFIPALISLKSRWQTLSLNSRWLVWTVFALFLFFTLSGSRRSYYILPVIPFAILMIADWLADRPLESWWQKAGIANLVAACLAFLFLFFDVAQPLYYTRSGVDNFAVTLKQEASQIKPWSDWHVVMLDGESKLYFYLQLPPSLKNYDLRGPHVADTLALLRNKPKDTIFITRKNYVPLLQSYFSGYQLVEMQPKKFFFGQVKDKKTSVAFIPRS